MRQPEEEPPPQAEEQQPQEEEANDNESESESGKRKLVDDPVEIAKQRAKEIALRLLNASDPKRQRLHPSLPSPPPPPPPASVLYATQPAQFPSFQATTKKITIPNGKVGVVIGKGGETIKYIQLQCGAKIQITKDQEADPHSLTRDVELMGTSEQINRAEQLISDVIAEADSGGTTSSTAPGPTSKQNDAEQFSLKVPNDKVGLLIGKGGETIKYMQTKSGTHIQIIPLHLPPGDPTTERTLYINGSAEQIEAAKEMVNDVMSGKRIVPSTPIGYSQPVYTTSNGWSQPGQPPMQQQPPQYGYSLQGAQPTSYYSSYTQQQTWDQSNLSTMVQTAQQPTGYGYYGQQPQMPPALVNPSYSYSHTPPISNNPYDQGYSQPPASYGQSISAVPTPEQQKPYAISSYGPPAVPSQPHFGMSSETTQAAPGYPPQAYSQPVTNPQTYWTTTSLNGQQSSQTGYDQTGYSQAVYGGPESVQTSSVAHAAYDQSGYALHATQAAPVNYVQGTYPLTYGPPQHEEQSSNNGLKQPLDGNSNSGHGSNSAPQEVAP